MKRRGQRWVALVSSVLLTVLLSGCPGSGEGDERPFAGTWQGTTSQGNNVSFVVANDHTITTVTAGAQRSSSPVRSGESKERQGSCCTRIE